MQFQFFDGYRGIVVTDNIKFQVACLFNDLLVVSKQKKEKYKVQNLLFLEGVSVTRNGK